MLIRSKHAFALVLLTSISAAAVPRALHPDIEIRKVGDFSRAVRIAQDPRDQQLYVMDQRAGIGRLDPQAGEVEILYTAADHDVRGTIWGFAIGPDGTMYITNNLIDSKRNTARVTFMDNIF